MAFEVRRCANPTEFQSALLAIGQYFGMESGDALSLQFERLLPGERMLAGWDGAEVVAGAGSFPFSLSVPGGELPCSGTTVVGVSPTHRRRGLLRAMMRAQLDEAHVRGEPLAALWASEETIYGRFGYGQAGFAGEVSIAKGHHAFARPCEQSGTIRLVGHDEALETFPLLWEDLRRERPGIPARSREWWQFRTLPGRPANGPNKLALLEIDAAPAAYAIYRHDPSWDGGVSTGRLVIVEAVGAAGAAVAEIWRFLLDIDWVASVSASLLPPDHPLFFLLAEPRRMGYRRGDGLWVRLVDVGAALAGRAYPFEPDLVFDVRDGFCPWNEGRWHLAGSTAERTEAPADLALDVSALGSAYLGGLGFAQLAQGGLVDELSPGAIERADSSFRHGLDPWCPEIF